MQMPQQKNIKTQQLKERKRIHKIDLNPCKFKKKKKLICLGLKWDKTEQMKQAFMHHHFNLISIP